MNKTTIELINKLAELSKGYTFNDAGIITTPGKFEGETIETLYFYDCFLNGGETILAMDESEQQIFNNQYTPYVYVAESNDGFVSLEHFVTLDLAESRESEDLYNEDSCDYDTED